MADRYLRASGNWNGPVWAATSGGAAGSAATPTADDEVYIAANYTVTLTSNAMCSYFQIEQGRLNLNGYELDCGNTFSAQEHTAKTIDLSSGALLVGTDVTKTGAALSIGDNPFNSNVTLIADDSLVRIKKGNTVNIPMGNHSYNDVVVELGTHTPSATTGTIFGSPTFRSLIIQSKNSAAHTVNFNEVGEVTVDKFIAIGSSSSNKLAINGTNNAIVFTENGTSYGQFVNMGIPAAGDVPTYVGSSSTQMPWTGGTWLLQDPPKISTLVDPLTTAPGSNPNWAVTGTVTQVTIGHGGGGYQVGDGVSTGNNSIVTSDTYDLTESELVMEVIMASSDPGASFGISPLPRITVNHSDEMWFFAYFHRDIYPSITDEGYGLAGKYHKIAISGGVFTAYKSQDAISWDIIGTKVLSDIDLLLLKSFRLRSNMPSPNSDRAIIIGSINPSLTPQNPGAFLPFF